MSCDDYRKADRADNLDIFYYDKEIFLKSFKMIFRPAVWLLNAADSHNGFVTATATIVIAYLTYSLSIYSKRQAEVGRDTLTLAFPPKIDVSHIQIWETGRGKPFIENPIPS